MNGKDLLAMALIAGIALIPLASVDPVPGNEIGLIVISAIGAVFLVYNTGGSFEVGPVEIGS